MYDVIIIGGGPSGCTAAIYCARANLSVAIIEREIIGGKITKTPEVNNIPGFVSISGVEYGQLLEEQLEANRVKIIYDEVHTISKSKDGTIYAQGDYDRYCGKTLIMATGTDNRLLGLPNEQSLIGKGISFCASCDGPFYKDKTVAVIGGGNSAVTEAIELSFLCKEVIVVQNLSELTAEKVLVDKLKSRHNITVITNAVVSSYLGDSKITGITIKNEENNYWDISVDGVFLAIGMVPNNKIIEGIVNTDSAGYIMNKFDGNIFACGDCLSGTIKQVATAIGSGVEAAMSAIKYMERIKTNG